LVRGAQPGDLLEVEFLEVLPQAWGFSALVPGFGYLRDLYPDPFIVHWDIADGWATSRQLPGVRIFGAPFMGVSGVAPSPAQVQAWNERERALKARGGVVMPPDPVGAVPASGPPAAEGLRTIPPRENGGNMDVKQLTRGAKLYLPVFVEGALFSTGDAHFAQGDGEVCLTAVEMGATVTVRFKLLKEGAKRRNIRYPRFTRVGHFTEPRWASPEKFTATIGLPLREDGANASEDLNVACRNALLNMIQLLQERGWTREQAYVICSVAVDLKISQVVDSPNFIVTAFLPEEIFGK
jgi:formamidase